MSIEDIAQRFSSRDGLRLRDYIEVALPVYHLRLRAITIAHKNVPPIEEFILRALAMDIRLSFRGDPNRTYRDEQGVLMQRQDLVDTKFDEVVQQFA